MPPNHAYIVVGLGNPGEEYARSRHNTGRLILEGMAARAQIKLTSLGKHNAHVGKGIVDDVPLTIVLPDTYMNKSGSSVKTLVTTIKAAERLIVVYDDLDLPWGTIRIAYGRGSGGHNGIESIRKSLNTKDFIRIRVGVAPVDAEGVIRKPRGADLVLKYIMGDFTSREIEELVAVEGRVRDAIVRIGKDGRQAAMNVCNQG